MKIDTSAFDEPIEQDVPSIDTSAFDEDEIQQQDQSENIIQTPLEAAVSELTPAVTAGTVEAIRRGVASSPVSSLAENLAFRGAGGFATPIGTDLIKEQAISKGISQVAPSLAVEPTVSPSKVGRAILDEKLLGRFGLGTKEGNLTRATKSAIEASKPTDELLKTLTTPISKQDIYSRTSEILDIPNLDLAVPENKMIIKALEKRKEDLQGFQLPIEAEQTKRQLQSSVNYQSEKSAAKSAVSKAQARATREQTEKAAELAGKLEDFLKLKSRSGNIQTAKDILESQIKPSGDKFLGSGVVNTAVDLLTKKTPAAGAALIDLINKSAKSKAAKALPYIAGSFVGGIPAVAGELAQEGLEPTESGAEPTTISEDVQGQKFAPFWEERGFTPEEAVQRAEISQFQEEYGTQPKTIQQEYPTNLALEGMSEITEAPEITAQREALQRQKQMLEESKRLREERRIETQKVKKLGALAPTYVEAPLKKVLKADNPAEIASIAQAMQSGTDKASQEYSRVLSQINNATPSQKEAILFGLNQQPAFRELVRKIKDQQKTEEETPLILKGPA